MLRIGDAGRGPDRTRGKAERNTGAGAAEGTSGSGGVNLFAGLLGLSQEKEEGRRAFEEYVAEMDAAASAVLRSPEEGTINRYVESVRSFLSKTVPEYSRLRVETVFQRRQAREFTTLRTIDEKLADLTVTIMARQQRGLEISSLFTEIRGLLVDLFH